jgi:hypothetical protein
MSESINITCNVGSVYTPGLRDDQESCLSDYYAGLRDGVTGFTATHNAPGGLRITLHRRLRNGHKTKADEERTRLHRERLNLADHLSANRRLK